MKEYKAFFSGALLVAMLVAAGINNSMCVSDGRAEFSKTILPRSSVAIVQSAKQHTDEVGYDEILSMTREAVRLAGGLDGLVSDGDTVVLKPNLVTIADYTLPGWQGRPLDPLGNGTTTDFRLTKAVVTIVREIDPTGKVYVMEGSAVPTKIAFAHFKYNHEDIPGVDKFIAIEMDTEGDYLVNVDLPGGLYKKRYAMNRIYKEAEVVISLPCLKNHWQAVVSGGIKNVGIGATPGNVYGYDADNPGRNNKIPHYGIELHEWIHDYFMARPVDFVIMDGLTGIQNGPTPCFDVSGSSDIKQDQMNMRLILASKDSVALDTIESLVMGWDPRSVEYLGLLAKDGIGNLDTAYIDVKGKRVDEVRKRFKGSTKNLTYGGNQYDDYTAPVLTVKTLEQKDGKLILASDAASDTRKVELYIDGTRTGDPVISDFELISLPIPEASSKASTLEIISYDYLLNAYRTTIDIGTFVN